MSARKPVTRSGVEVTDELAEQLADEAEVGYDLDEGIIEHRGLGRPPLDAGTSPQVTFRLPEGLRRAADERAAREGKTVSEVAREALERHLSAT